MKFNLTYYEIKIRLSIYQWVLQTNYLKNWKE